MGESILDILIGVFLMSAMAVVCGGSILFSRRISEWVRARIERLPAVSFGRRDAVRNASPGNVMFVGIVGLLIIGFVGSRVVPELWTYPSDYAAVGVIAAVAGPGSACMGFLCIARAKAPRSSVIWEVVGGGLIVVGVLIAMSSVVVFT